MGMAVLLPFLLGAVKLDYSANGAKQRRKLCTKDLRNFEKLLRVLARYHPRDTVLENFIEMRDIKNV